MPQPTFLVIGAGRSGTTSLHRYLSAHPEIFIPSVKSPSYFYAASDTEKNRQRRHETRSYFVPNRSDYESLFDGSESFSARGEVSPAYLAATRVPDLISADLKEVQLIAIIRNPIDRLVARFVARQRDGLERTKTVSELVESELHNGLDLSDTAGTYVAAGFISQVLTRYFELFDPKSIQLHLFDDFVEDPQKSLRSIFDFLRVDSEVVIDTSTHHNASGGVISSPGVRMIWQRSSRVRQIMRPLLPQAARSAALRVATRSIHPFEIAPGERSLLAHLYEEEIAKLSSMLDRDLSHWLSNETAA